MAATPPLPELDALLVHLVKDAQGWRASYRGMELRSAFQPVLSITHARIVGYEALLRVTGPGGVAQPPAPLFARAAVAGDSAWLDRLSRTLHMANFVEQGAPSGWLFLNCLPEVFETAWQHSFFIKHLAAHYGMPHERIVIELLELPSADENRLTQSIDKIRTHDFLIAIDDFGAGFSNFDRVWSNRPDIVKLDRTLVQRVGAGEDGVQLIRHLVTMLHHAGAMVLAEGVETEQELMILMAADIDFIQGYWLARPHASLSHGAQDSAALIAGMWPSFRAYQAGYRTMPREPVTAFERALERGAQAFALRGDLAEVGRAVFALPGARRVFCTDAHGVQRGESLVRDLTGQPDAPEQKWRNTLRRLQPLYPDANCNWSRRAYFKRALAKPGHVATMGPHFSLTDGKNCFTAAIAVDHLGAQVVVCADFIAAPGSELL